MLSNESNVLSLFPLVDAVPFVVAGLFMESLLTPSLSPPDDFFLKSIDDVVLDAGFRNIGTAAAGTPPLFGGVTTSLPRAEVFCDASLAVGLAMVDETFALLAAASLARASASVSAFCRNSRFCMRDPVAETSSAEPFATPSPRFAASASSIFVSSERYIMAAFEVYFFSIFWFMLEWPCLRKYWRAFAFPPSLMESIWRCVHSSRSTLRTKVVCTPMDLCVAEQSRHRKMPEFVCRAFAWSMRMCTTYVCVGGGFIIPFHSIHFIPV
mmetsp:Transcript_2140/g.5950  ORF Transcript_2140/g.5950 Transcript_2140/m.5950 type:complete len:268 (-) Transcript_2140:199-1002(-)